MSKALKRRIGRLERAAAGRAHNLFPCEMSDYLADLSPVEREQRLLAIRETVAGSPAAIRLLDEALEKGRSVVYPLSPESTAILDEARTMLPTR